MNTAKIYVATSIDGYIASADHGLEWLEDTPNPDCVDMGFADHMASIDAIVMGRGTFEAVQNFEPWPYDKPVLVASSTLETVPSKLAGHVQLVQGSPAEIVEQCDSLGYRRVYVDGGKLPTSFLDADLIDEITISIIPVILGGGIPLFGSISQMRWWHHLRTETFRGGVVQVTYRRSAEAK
ncbi:MAG: dihydrofolate reductase family protein [Myxococcales bacterium]|nr:dihydrofolate reductase family protein [Myxococcales bacterium]